MRRAVPFALCTLVSVALLGFALRTAAAAVGADPDDVEVPNGWQVDATLWGLVGLAAVLGVVAAVVARRRARALEGEGVLLGVPLLLGGLLLSGLPSQVLGPALEKAGSYTEEAKAWRAEAARYLAEEKLHPVPVDFGKAAASPDLAALVPTAAELGPGWYDGQRPAVAAQTVQGRVVTSTMLIRASRAPHGWDVDRFLRVRVTHFGSPQAAAAWLQGLGRRNPGVRYVQRRVAGLPVEQVGGESLGTGSLAAFTRRGARVWEINLMGHNGDRLADAQKDAVLQAVARHIAAA